MHSFPLVLYPVGPTGLSASGFFDPREVSVRARLEEVPRTPHSLSFFLSLSASFSANQSPGDRADRGDGDDFYAVTANCSAIAHPQRKRRRTNHTEWDRGHHFACVPFHQSLGWQQGVLSLLRVHWLLLLCGHRPAAVPPEMPRQLSPVLWSGHHSQHWQPLPLYRSQFQWTSTKCRDTHT